jgi:hypothetical protein
MNDSVVTFEQYAAAIGAVHHALETTHPDSWVPKIVQSGLSSDGMRWEAVYDVDGTDAGASWGGLTTFDGAKPIFHPRSDPATAFEEAYSGAMLRLVKDDKECALFACPVGRAVLLPAARRSGQARRPHGAWIAPPVDVVVGFQAGTDAPLTLAWHGDCVYPMIGRKGQQPCFSVPPGATAVVCAALDTRHRRAVALFADASRDLTKRAAAAGRPQPPA